MKSIRAVVVLYNQSIASSPTCTALMAALNGDGPLRDRLELLVVDNSPEATTMPAEFPFRYLHDGLNPGLAARYNLALQMAAQEGCTWLLLLDQDTSITPEYLSELLELSDQLASREEIVAIAPKLVMHGVLQSPHLPCYRPPEFTLDLSSYGVQPGEIRVYNSGSLLRVGAVKAVGGFPEEYQLDQLDHAIYARMQANGGKVYLMNARIEHEMAISDPDRYKKPAFVVRQKNAFAAEARFYHEYGTVKDQLHNRIDMLRRAAGSAKHGLFGEAGRLARAALTPAPWRRVAR